METLPSLSMEGSAEGWLHANIQVQEWDVAVQLWERVTFQGLIRLWDWSMLLCWILTFCAAKKRKKEKKRCCLTPNVCHLFDQHQQEREVRQGAEPTCKIYAPGNHFTQDTVYIEGVPGPMRRLKAGEQVPLRITGEQSTSCVTSW